ncbi:PQQ-dependent sugar dehydrogenase [Gloeobacter kilaueensis]|uniref:L-sorbosone dehydrogenase n=1 Tax=Gloeobacter kilaueensis (strain ATCC BAA-2537 / CCAP 1431/1 / ULC 316 / JS1) TaxID=1183438 RepID=U5QKW9_GLOK1|nr:sorbosone dehydrogenase family protein [Gloeobacter kilaueensis]AGY59571.1 L-sorbosone dehydrogenase [Gloeobacter kilaueensis JS1]
MRIWKLVLLFLTLAPVAAQAAPNLKLINLPSGFEIEVFADGLEQPRALALSPEGDLFVTEMGAGRVSALPDRDKDGKADRRVVFASGLNHPHGLAFYKSGLYIGETNEVVRFDYQPGKPTGSNKRVVVPNLPDDGGHSTRTVAFGPDNKLYVSIGSSCNVCNEKDKRRATIMQYNPDGSGGRIYASGLRNAVGLRFDSQGRLWATSNGRDWLGDNIPPDELHIVRDGLNAGWPFCHAGKYRDDRFGSLGSCSAVTPPDWSFQAHSAPLGVSEYTGSQFPADYKGDLFVAFHGSWNRSQPTGYKVVRAHLENGRVKQLTDFATGWLRPDRDVMGRPVDVLTAPDGSLFVTDDAAGRVYRIRYSATQAKAGP